jgi:hypothetical protein
VQYEWDEVKDQANQKKHGLPFMDARELFDSGVDYLEIFDADHSIVEDRFIAIGPIRRGLIVVVYTEKDDDTIRIIGARFATKAEQTLYRSHMRRLR